MSFVIFPVENSSPMIAMVAGTQGLSPDEHILGKPGHTRKMNAIVSWLNTKAGRRVAWAKRDAVRTDLTVPDNVQKEYQEYKDVFSRYGGEIYGFCKADPEILEDVQIGRAAWRERGAPEGGDGQPDEEREWRMQ